MKLLSGANTCGRSPWHLLALVLAAGVASLGCAPAEDASAENAAGGEATAVETAAGEAMARGGEEALPAQEAPACRFTASGEELTGRASPPDSASAQLGDGTAKLCYGAPSMRGREIMGGLVGFDRPWRTGANEPTTLHLTFAAEVGDVQLEPGSYALYTIPGEAEWTIVLNSDPDRWGIPINDEVRANDVGSFTVASETIEDAVETLSIRMETVDESSARVVLEWENTRVSFPLRRVEG